MSDNYTLFNKNTMEFRYGSGMCVYSEFFSNGRLLCSEYHASGIPYVHTARMESAPAFKLVMDGRDLGFNWNFVDYSAADEADGRKRAVISLEHRKLPFLLNIHTLCGDNGYYTRYLEITNKGDISASITAVAPLAGTLWELTDNIAESVDENPPYRVGYFKDCHWGHEGNFGWTDVPYNTEISFGSKTGRSGHTHPFCVANSKLLGGYFAAQLEWGANWKFSFFNDHRRNNTQQFIKLSFAMAPDSAAPMRVISPGETVATPKVHFGYTCRDFDYAINRLHGYQRGYLLPKPACGLQPVIYNHWGFMQHELSEGRLMDEVDKAVETGCEVFTVDAGWFGDAGSNWFDAVGNWKAGERLPRDLDPVFEYARSKGLKCGLWVELEAAGPNSEVRLKRPEWFAKRYGSIVERSLDLAKPEVKAYLKDEVIRIIDRYKLELFRLDYNNIFYNEGGFNDIDGYDENNLWRHMESLYEIFDYARDKYPEVIFENCASGGGRTDFGQMTRFSHTQISDWYLFPRIVRIFNGISMALPPEAMLMWYGEIMAAHKYGNADSQLQISVLGVPGISGVSPIGEPVNPAYLVKLKKYIAVYKDFIRPIHRDAQIYHHTQEIPGQNGKGWCVLEFTVPDGSKGYAAAFRLPGVTEDTYTLKFRGVDPSKKYRLTAYPDESAFEVSGAQLAQQGYEIRLESALTSKLVLIETM